MMVVSHDLEPMRAHRHGEHSQNLDPDAYVRVDDVAAALADAPGWDIEVYEKRARPLGPPRRTTSTTSSLCPPPHQLTKSGGFRSSGEQQLTANLRGWSGAKP